MTDIEAIMRLSPVIPVITVGDARHAAPIAEALVRGGVRALEVTLRTPAALDAIREMTRVDGATVGAGTVLSARDLDAALEAGAEFIVSPGLTSGLAGAIAASPVPFLPGVATASDMMRAHAHGFSCVKFFPAEANGGVATLKALAAPFPFLKFCPTGGVTLAKARNWLSVPGVVCVGGSWLVPPGAPDVAAIERSAREAAALSVA